jgi:3-hydroxypropanoate dehydrogenase
MPVLDDAAADLLFRDAHTAHAFTDTPVTREHVEGLYALIQSAPTSMNTQPLRMVMVASPEAKARLVPLMSSGNQAKTQQAPVTAILAADLDFHDHLPEVLPHSPNARDTFLDPEARAKFARNQAWLQAGYFIIGVRAMGLAAGPMGGFDHEGVDREFLADRPWASILTVNIGFPSAEAFRPRNPRLAVTDVVEWA